MRPTCLNDRRRTCNYILSRVVPALSGLLVAATAPAGVVTYPLGEQDFPAGAGPILVRDARAAGANEPFPFNGTVFGDDRTPSFGKMSFRYAFTHESSMLGATLTLGLIGLDSPPGAPPTVKLFLDGAQQPNDAFAGVSAGGDRSSASVISVPVPMDLLADGMLEVMIKAFRPGPSYPGNAIEADFADLTIVNLSTPPTDIPDDGNGGGDDDGPAGPGGGGGTIDPGPLNPIDPINGGGGSGGQPVPSVPLPPAIVLGGIGLLLAAWMRKRV